MREIGAALLSIALLPSPASGQKASIDPDAKCAAAFHILADSAPKDPPQSVVAMASFYLGKLVARFDPKTVKAVMETAESQIDRAQVGSIGKNCLSEVQHTLDVIKSAK